MGSPTPPFLLPHFFLLLFSSLRYRRSRPPAATISISDGQIRLATSPAPPSLLQQRTPRALRRRIRRA
uniref:Uncharacterized protein n=1 Tax=Oryza meridionalis TaxID=40149 RepID=A0A0E0E5N3_9ORYZ